MKNYLCTNQKSQVRFLKNDTVEFDIQKGPKGLNAVNVKAV
jgi:cold shock CspA family protein